mmetsp:Transcript_36985/g.110051  ORF Transcript_36985/g.110051 Transcript_36985/m.110051 type:complete len:282 (+) Transcript_36985:627-1472(+)
MSGAHGVDQSLGVAAAQVAADEAQPPLLAQPARAGFVRVRPHRGAALRTERGGGRARRRRAARRPAGHAAVGAGGRRGGGARRARRGGRDDDGSEHDRGARRGDDAAPGRARDERAGADVVPALSVERRDGAMAGRDRRGGPSAAAPRRDARAPRGADASHARGAVRGAAAAATGVGLRSRGAARRRAAGRPRAEEARDPAAVAFRAAPGPARLCRAAQVRPVALHERGGRAGGALGWRLRSLRVHSIRAGAPTLHRLPLREVGDARHPRHTPRARGGDAT